MYRTEHLGAAQQQWVSEDLLPKMYHALIHSCIWNAMRQTAGLEAQLLGKALPQRCQRRRYEAIVRRLTLPRFATTGHRFVMILQCSLLGTYRHCVGQTETPRSARLRLQILMLTPQSPLFQRLMETHPFLMSFATREYLAFLLSTNSLLRHHINAQFPVRAFCRLAITSMQRVRRHLGICGSLERFVRSPGLSGLTAGLHDKFLSVCYQRMRPSFFKEVSSMRVFESQKQCAVSQEHSDVLHQICTRVDPMVPDRQACQLFLLVLPLLGGAATAAVWLRRLQVGFESFAIGKRLLRHELSLLVRKYPYTMNLLQLTALLWHRHTEIQVVELAHHQAQAQARRINEVVGLPPGAPRMSRELSTFYFCRVCLTVYSIVRRPVSCVKNVFRYGLRDAPVDLLSDTLVCYCNKKVQLGHLRCEQQPVAGVDLVGRMIVIKREIFFICCGAGCGSFAKLCPQLCTYTRDGYLCHVCSEQRRLHQFLDELNFSVGRCVIPGVSSGWPRLSCDLCLARPQVFHGPAVAAFQQAIRVAAAQGARPADGPTASRYRPRPHLPAPLVAPDVHAGGTSVNLQTMTSQVNPQTITNQEAPREAYKDAYKDAYKEAPREAYKEAPTKTHAAGHVGNRTLSNRTLVSNLVDLHVYPQGVLLCARHHQPDLVLFLQQCHVGLCPDRQSVIDLIRQWHVRRKHDIATMFRARNMQRLAHAKAQLRSRHST